MAELRSKETSTGNLPLNTQLYSKRQNVGEDKGNRTSVMASGLGPRHVSRVRLLYKTILRLHRGMPLELRALGDDYVKAEFRRHKKAEPAFIAPFMREWANYALVLAKQLQAKEQSNTKFGAYLETATMESMSDEQVAQMFELYKETSKPVDPENPLGENPSVKPEL